MSYSGRTRLLALTAVAALLVSACGTRLTKEELLVTALDGQVTDSSSEATATAPGASQASTSGRSGSTGSVPAGPAGSATPGNDVAGSATGADTGSQTGGVTPDQVDGAPGDDPTTPPGGDVEAAKSPVTIGHIGTYSGLVGAIFTGGRPMAQAWANDVNERGGLNGHPVELITADDGGDPARAQALAKDMVENRGVIAFMGNLTPISVQGYADYVASVGVPVVGGDGAQDHWWNNPMLFAVGTYIVDQAINIARVGVDDGHEIFGLIYCTEADACATFHEVWAEGGVEEAGGSLDYTAAASLAQPTFTRECTGAQMAGVTSLGVAGDINMAARVARDCQTQGYSPQILVSGLGAVNRAEEDPNLEGLGTAVPVFPWMATDTPAARAFHEVQQKYAPDADPSGATSYIWASAKLLEAATVNLPDDPTPDDVLAGLYALPDGFRTDGLTPPLTFTEGQPHGRSRCYTVAKIVNGEWVAPFGSEFLCP